MSTLSSCDDAQTWFYKRGDETVGPVSRDAIDQILGSPIQIRQGDGEWQSENDADQPIDEQSADLKAMRSASSVTRVLTILVLLAAAISGWGYHFVMTQQGRRSHTIANSSRPDSKSNVQGTDRPKTPGVKAKSSSRPVIKKAGRPKPR